jgi:hypothetical protein
VKRFLLVTIILSFQGTFLLFSQNGEKFLSLRGYVSNMQSVMFDSLSGKFINDNLIHNRLNLEGSIGSSIKFAAGLRNRLFTGDMLRLIPAYPEMIADDEGWADLSWNLLNEQSFFLNTTIDRLWVDFNFGKFQARVGRQRINWGQTLVWNPNDIFNAYSFFDFDYPERPGSDAVRLQFYPGSSSAIEFVVKADYDNKITAAGMYRFNLWEYDFQFLGGYYNGKDLVAGAGWSGSIGSVSFRGEASWFSSAENSPDTKGTGLFTTGLDKVFKNNSMAQVQVMLCNNPQKLYQFSSFYFGRMSAKSLAFSKFTAFGQYSYPVTPLFTLTASGMWFPDLKGNFCGLSLDYSLAENLDFSIIYQHFSGTTGSIKSDTNMGFLRIKFSF